MDTIIAKLNKLKIAKEAIRTSINNQGGLLTENTKFSDYPMAINNIQIDESDNPIQHIIDNQLGDKNPGCEKLFYLYKGSSLDNVITKIDTSKVTTMSSMFDSCSNLITIPEFNTSSCTDMMGMFSDCRALTTIPQLNTSHVTNMSWMFFQCYNLITIPPLDLSSCTSTARMFEGCYALQTVPELDTSKVTNMYQMFYNSNVKKIMQLDLDSCTSAWGIFDYCNNLTYLKLLNIRINLQIGSNSGGYYITKECLIQIISELIDTGSSKTLTMGTANKAKIADTYVKLVEDDGTGKHPFEVCTSTDEGAMTIEAYCNGKNWTLA